VSHGPCVKSPTPSISCKTSARPVQAQLSRVVGSSVWPLLPADVDDELSTSRCLARMATFERVPALRKEGRTAIDIVRQMGFAYRTNSK